MTILFAIKRATCLAFLILLSISLHAQVTLQGTVRDSETRELLPFCNVGIQGTWNGTITNADGVFFLRQVRNSDTLVFSFLGYVRRSVPVSELVRNREVLLDPSALVLQEVTVSAKDDFLYQLLENCRMRSLKDNSRRASKVYYGLQTRTQEQPIELLECYYNGYTSGPVVDHLTLKNGRIGLTGVDNRFFLTLNTSRAVTGMRLLSPDALFPANPLQYGKRESKKYFSLSMERSDDKIYRVRFTGRSPKLTCFSGLVWIDRESSALLRIDLEINNTLTHPFTPIFPRDSLSDICMNLSQTFRKDGNSTLPDHFNFSYDFSYKSVRDSAANRPASFIIRRLESRGVISFYDYDRPFILPFFEYDNDYDDYRKMSIIPYNEVFWKNTGGLLLTEKQKEDLGFISREGCLVNFREGNFGSNFLRAGKEDSLFKVLNLGLYEFNYVFWSPEKRIRINRKLTNNYAYPPKIINGVIESDLYSLNAQIFLDVTEAGDSLYTRSFTVFDAAKSFYHLPDEPWTATFLNIYFDLCELQRRKMDQSLGKSGLTQPRISAIYRQATEEMKTITARYIQEVRAGHDEDKMRKWNRYILDNLGIDNIGILHPDTPEKP